MAGIVTSGTLMLLGFVLYAAQPSWYDAPVPAATIRWILDLFIQHGPSALLNPYLSLYTGIFALMLTPIMRLLITGWTFFVDRDWRYVAITAVVLLVIGVSIVFAVVH